MTRRAVGAELPVVFVLRRMTAVAILRRPFELPVGVTRGAIHAGVLPRQREAGAVVVETHVPPRRGIVTRRAIRAELPVVRIFRRMATVAILRRPFELPVGVTRSAIHGGVLPRQRETGIVVVETHVPPFGRRVAGGAIGAELPVVCVFCRMATVAVLWCAFEGVVHMAGFTFNLIMRAHQSEAGAAVVEVDIAPI